VTDARVVNSLDELVDKLALETVVLLPVRARPPRHVLMASQRLSYQIELPYSLFRIKSTDSVVMKNSCLHL